MGLKKYKDIPLRINPKNFRGFNKINCGMTPQHKSERTIHQGRSIHHYGNIQVDVHDVEKERDREIERQTRNDENAQILINLITWILVILPYKIIKYLASKILNRINLYKSNKRRNQYRTDKRQRN